MSKNSAMRDADKTIQVLFELSSALNTASSLDAAYESIQKSLSKILNTDNMFIALYHQDKDSITYPYNTDKTDKDSLEMFGVSKGQSPAANVINQKKALLIKSDDLIKMAADKSCMYIDTSCKVWIGSPLIIGDRTLGALVLKSYTSKNMFKKSDLDLLSFVSDFVAVLIEKKSSEEALKKSETINEVLFAVSNAVNTTQDLAELYKSIHNSLNTVIDLTNFIVGLYSQKDEMITWEYYVDQFDNLQGQSMALAEGSVGRDVIASGKSLFLKENDLSKRILKNKAIGTWPKIWLGVPLKVDNQVIGYMATQSYSDPDLFSQKDMEVFRSVSDQVATAIERKRAEDAEKKSKEINRVMFKIANAANATENLNELYESIHETLAGILDVTNFIIGLYDHDKDIITYPYYVDETGDDFSEIQNASTSGIISTEVINLAKPFFITKDEIIERAKKMGTAVVGGVAEQWLGVPLKIKKQVIGVIVVQSYSNPSLYSQKDVEILLVVSGQIAMAIDRKREEEARKKSEEINKTLFEISNAVNTTRNLEQLCKSIHQSLKKVIYVKNFSLSLYDKEADRLNFLYHSDEIDFRSHVENVSQSSSVTFEAMQKGSPLLLDAQGQRELVDRLGGDMIGTLAESWLCVPLRVDNEIIGAIISQDYEIEDCFSKEDIELLSLVSGQIALAIQRKRAEDAEMVSKEINRVMFAISNAVNTTENLYELYKSIHMSLGNVLDVSNFMIGIYDQKKDMISYPYFRDQRDDDYSDIHNVSNSGILASEIINHAEPFFITRDKIIERAKKRGYRGLGVIPEQWFGVPLIIKEQVRGVMVVQSYSNPEHFGEKDVGILLSVSEQVAMAIERKQSEENIKQNEKLTGTMFRISNAVNTTDNLDHLYQSIYNSLNALIKLPNFFIAIVNEDTKTMGFPFHKDEYDSGKTLLPIFQSFEEKPSITFDVIKSKQPMFLKKKKLDEYAKLDYIMGTVPVIWLGIPLIIRGKVIGVMAVQHYSDPDYFTQKDMDLFIAVSDQVALAIDRKRSQEIISDREKQFLQLSKQTQEFSIVAASIISMKDEAEIFKHISRAIVKYSDYNRLIISYFIEEPPFREIIQYEGIKKEEIEKVRNKKAPREYYERIFKACTKIGNLSWYLPYTEKKVLGKDIPIFLEKNESENYSDNGWHHEDMIFIRMNDSDGNFIGVISVDDSKSGKKPTKITVRPLEIFSSLISQIMIFRKIQNELKDHKENLQKKVADRTKELTNEIAERIQIESRLEKARAEAEKAARVKGEFLTNMSHEIRTPINGIMGMAEIAMGNNLDGNLRRIIKTIDSEAGSLLTIINRILDFSKIEAGKLTLEHIAFDLRNTFEKACSLVTVGMNKKDIEFISFLAPDVPSKLMGDPGRLRQVILNLAGNAMKFTHKGEIFLKAEVIKYYKTEVEIRFIVKDTGIGIEEAKQKTIFDSFNQADGSTTRKYGGTGLGTTIAKQLVELMGGKIGFESEVGKGTTFWFSIKFEKQKGKAVQPAERSINLNGLKILVIDDNETNRFVLAEYLKAFGIQPIVVGNEKAGIETIELSFKDKKPVDSVIIDLEHSDIGVFEFAKKIRQNKNFAKLPIILLASSGEIGDGKICKDIGIDAYLLKPVKQDELKRAIGKALYNFSFEKKDQQLITRHTIAEESYKDLHVLVVEDYATNQQIASKHLTGAGYKVTIAKNGKIAVDLFKKQDFDLIMMDIQMPVMDGYQATKLIREYELKISNSNINDSDNFNKKNKIPIIAMTAHAIVGYREKCLKAGMDDYISKPLRREKFLGIVGKWVSKNKSFLDDGRTGDAEGSQDYGNYLAHAYDIPMDFELALNELEGDKEFLLDILHEFLFNVESQLVLIKTALQNNDSKTVQKESHSIKGGAANLTAYSLSKIAHELEDIGASKNLENGLKVCENLEKALSTLKSFIAKSYI